MTSDLHKKHKKLKKLKVRNIVINTICIIMVLLGISWTVNYFWKYVNYEITNDAMVDQYIAPLNIRASGYIKQIRFTEHQQVHAGDTLLVLDNREYQIRVKDAQAALMDAQGAKGVLHSGIQTSQVNIAIQQANIAQTKAQLWQQEQEYRRYSNLLKEESVSEQQYEQVKANYEATQAKYQAITEQKNAAQWQYSETNNKTMSIEANILRKEADLDMAQLNLSYTVLIAPYDGYMGRRTLEVGQFVQSGQTISFLVRGNDKWITANYKETQIGNIHIGQKVRIRVDALAGRIFDGTVSAISQATGSKYALIPTDNAAGNFVKVQQRIPVRITINDASAEEMESLRAGMMVETEAIKKEK
ncbi:MAG: HlyD family secretion protein [Mucinivorans sp.]